MTNRVCRLVAGAALVLVSVQASAADLKVEVKAIKNTQATIYLTLWNKPKDFLHARGRVVALKPSAPSAYAVFTDLAPGEYSLAAYQDINGNKRMDSNFIGIPKEPTAISNDATGSFGPLSYDDARFSVGKDNLQIAVTLHD